MHCNDVPHWLSQQLDGDLGPADQERLAAHLALCDRCRRDGELLALGKELCQASRALCRPSDDFAARVLRSVRIAKSQPATLWAQLGTIAEPLLPAFAMLVILFLGIFFLTNQFRDARLGAYETTQDLFVPAEEGSLLIALRAEDITTDHVIKTVLEDR